MNELVGIDKEKVQQHTERVLNSPLFSSSPRQRRFLEYLVKHTLDNDSERLKGYTIGVEVFDKAEDFDPSIDAIVRVEATRIRNKLREYYDSIGQNDEIQINFRKGSYQLDFSHHLPTEQTLVTHKPNRLEVVTDKPSMVVLPLDSICENDSQDYFSDGITDSLITMLSRISGLFVISRQSSFAYRKTLKTSKQIAAELGVQYLLEGSIQHAGDRVRISVHLVEAESDTYVWSERFDRELKDIFALQDDVTKSIVNALHVRLTREEDNIFGYQETPSIEAHDALLLATSTYLKYSQKSVEEAVGLFANVIERDPNYVAAHAWLARGLAFQWAMRWQVNASILDTALCHAQKAVKIKPDSPFAISILGWIYLWRGDSQQAIEYCKQAVSLDPNNAESLLFLSISLASAGQGEEALVYIEKALRLTPIPAAFYQYALACCFYVLKEYKKAIEIYEFSISLSPNFIPNHIGRMYAYAHLSMFEQAKKSIEPLHKLIDVDKYLDSISIWTNQEILKQEEVLRKKILSD